MDKYEYKSKTERMLELMESGAYSRAAAIADEIDWRRVRNAVMLSNVSEIYEKTGEYQKGYDILTLKNKNSFFADTVGFLFQNFALLENKTVKENLSLIKKSSRTKVSLKEALNRVGLSKEVNKKVYQLSGGEQQRVALARLMMKKCSVVLADEPTGSLDKKNRDIVMRLLHELNEEGKTVIIVTHDQGIIEDEPYVVKI